MKITDFFKPDMIKLIHAIEKGKEAKAGDMIKQGLSLNIHTNKKMSPLFWLLIQQNKDAMRLAIKLGADPDFPKPNGDSLVTMLAGRNQDEFLLILLEGGADASAVDSEGYPAMLGAVEEGRIEQIEMLIRFGGDINLTNPTGDNSALYGSYINRYEIVHYLIEQGVDYNAVNIVSTSIAWNIHEKLSNNELNPEGSAYDWVLKIKQQLIDRGVKFPPRSPLDIDADLDKQYQNIIS